MIPSGRLQVANAPPTQLSCCFHMKIIAFATLHQSHSLYGVFYFPFSVWLTTFDLQTDGNIRMVYLTLAVDRCFSLSLNQWWLYAEVPYSCLHEPELKRKRNQHPNLNPQSPFLLPIRIPWAGIRLPMGSEASLWVYISFLWDVFPSHGNLLFCVANPWALNLCDYGWNLLHLWCGFENYRTHALNP